MIRIEDPGHYLSRTLFMRESYILSNVISSMHDSRRQPNWFRLKGAANIFLRIALQRIAMCSTYVSIVRREVNRAIISIRGITDVSSFHTVSTSRKLAPRPTRAAGWQSAPKKHRKTTRPVITVAPALSSHYQRALARCINPNTFFRVVCFVNSRSRRANIRPRISIKNIFACKCVLLPEVFYLILQQNWAASSHFFTYHIPITFNDRSLHMCWNITSCQKQCIPKDNKKGTFIIKCEIDSLRDVWLLCNIKLNVSYMFRLNN